MKLRNYLQSDWPLLLMLLLSFALPLLFWNQLSDIVPTHWNLHGEIDGYSSKPFALIMLPTINLALYVLVNLLHFFKPNQLGENKQRLHYIITTTILAVICGYLYAITSPENPINAVQLVIIGAILIIGNMMGKLRQNWFIGIRVPWTLRNEEVWNTVHRAAGKLWVMTSLLALMARLVLPDNLFWIAFLIYMATIVTIPIVHSYRLYHQLKQNEGA